MSSEVSTSGAVSLNWWKAQPLLGACGGSKAEETWRLALGTEKGNELDAVSWNSEKI